MARKTTAKTTANAPSGRQELSVEGDLTIYTAAQQREALLAWANLGAGPAILNLAHVLDCDTAGLQLLLATQATLKEEGVALELSQVSSCVRDALHAYGFDDKLQSCMTHEGAKA